MQERRFRLGPVYGLVSPLMFDLTVCLWGFVPLKLHLTRYGLTFTASLPQPDPVEY